MSDDSQDAPRTTRPAQQPLRLLGAEAVVCEGDSCLITPTEPAQS